jgi:transposase-like protein
MIGFQVAYAEDTEQWTSFVTSLKQRGLLGKSLKLIMSDDHSALTAAIDQVYPAVPVQICITHKMRNVLQKTSHQHKVAVAEDLKEVYKAETKEQGLEYMRIFAKKWYIREERAVKSLQFDFERSLTYLTFPKSTWSSLRTTNILEREFRELRRRIKVFDSSFNDEQSLNRYATTTFDYLNTYYPATLTHK